MVGAQLEESDWKFAGRNETSRRTITAAVMPSGYAKMLANWIYRDTCLAPEILTIAAAGALDPEAQVTDLP